MSEEVIKRAKELQKKQKPQYKTVRQGWGGVNPCTRVYKTPKDFNKCDRNKDKARLKKYDSRDE